MIGRRSHTPWSWDDTIAKGWPMRPWLDVVLMSVLTWSRNSYGPPNITIFAPRWSGWRGCDQLSTFQKKMMFWIFQYRPIRIKISDLDYRYIWSRKKLEYQIFWNNRVITKPQMIKKKGLHLFETSFYFASFSAHTFWSQGDHSLDTFGINSFHAIAPVV